MDWGGGKHRRISDPSLNKCSHFHVVFGRKWSNNRFVPPPPSLRICSAALKIVGQPLTRHSFNKCFFQKLEINLKVASFFTDHARCAREGYVFTGVCHSVRVLGGGVGSVLLGP